jgi:HPt (histidine-containing phosphotransfer) domain-containing protein
MTTQEILNFGNGALPFAGEQNTTAPVLNMSAAWKAVEGNRQLFRQAVSVILDDCPRLLEALEMAAAWGDVPALRRAAHTLASSLRLFGMTSGAEVAHQFQKIGTIEGAQAAELLADLRQECHQLQMLLASELRQRLRASPTGDASPDNKPHTEGTE